MILLIVQNEWIVKVAAITSDCPCLSGLERGDVVELRLCGEGVGQALQLPLFTIPMIGNGLTQKVCAHCPYVICIPCFYICIVRSIFIGKWVVLRCPACTIPMPQLCLI